MPSIDAGACIAGAITNDWKLIQQAVAGDSEAQTRLVKTHSPMLYRTAFKVLWNKEDAEDAVQDGWCRAYSKLHTFEGRSSLSTWLTRIVINSALMIRRKNRHEVQQTLDDGSNDQSALQHSLVDERATPEEACRKAEMNDLLAQQIDRLPSTTRTAFLLREVGGLSTAESTRMLGINKSALKSRVLRARRRLTENVVQVLHSGRQKTFIRRNGFAANFLPVTPSKAQQSNDRL